MNSLPPISHHLFVAAIGNDNQLHEKPKMPERPFNEATHGAAAHALSVVDETVPLLRRGARPLRSSAHRARA